MVKETGFYALLSRMRYISRWGLMRSSIPENVQEHSHETAVYAHALGIIRREIFGQECDAERLAVLAVYHDASEILTGDLPTPIKYHDRTLRDAYKKVEHAADERLLAMLPEELRGAYESAFTASEDEEKLVKAADKLSALRQCIEERKAGNNEFISAEKQTRAILDASPLPEVKYFLDKFIPAFELTLDELGTIDEEGKA